MQVVIITLKNVCVGNFVLIAVAKRSKIFSVNPRILKVAVEQLKQILGIAICCLGKPDAERQCRADELISDAPWK